MVKRTTRNNNKPERLVAFKCSSCGTAVGDGLYRREPGDELCFDCWCDYWYGEILPRVLTGRDHTRLDQMMILLAMGYNKAEAAKALDVSRRTVSRWVLRVRDNPDLLPDWMESLS